STTKVKHTHTRLQVGRGSQPLGEPQRVGRTAHIGNHPFRVVFVRPWKPLINEPVIRRHETSLTERRTKACKLSTNNPVLQFPLGSRLRNWGSGLRFAILR